MILLPDIIINNQNINAILSIQEPFTLNGYIITDIERDTMSSDPWQRQRVRLRNEADYFVVLETEDLEVCFRQKMNDFIAQYGRGANVAGRRDVYDWMHYDFYRYISEIEEQCNRIRSHGYCSSSNSYLERLKMDVMRQNRELHEPSRIESGYRPTLDDYTRDEMWQSWINATPATYLSNIVLSNDSWDTITSTVNEDRPQNKKYIHAHNYKPEYISYYMPGEDKETTLLLGAEIEVDGGGESEEHAKRALEIMCGIDENTGNSLEDKIYCMHDGSLTNGIEFATMPCSLEYHRKNMKYKKMFRYLVNNGYKAHDTTTCGLHIHANRSYLGKTELVQQLTISKILYILEKFNDKICLIARRSSHHYSQFVGDGKDENSVVELYSKYKNKNKYVALNLAHSETIEFRCFKGTLKYETYMLTLEFVKKIIDYAKSINIEEIELIQWEDLMNTFSYELKEYYNERLEKETKKKEEKERSERESFYNRFVDARSITTNSLSSYRQERTSSGLDAFRNAMLRRATVDCSCNVSMNLGTGEVSLIEPTIEEVRTVERTALDELKHKEKSLKKQIKYSNNFMEKKRLEIELKEVQKQIKIEKRQTRNNIAS